MSTIKWQFCKYTEQFELLGYNIKSHSRLLLNFNQEFPPHITTLKFSEIYNRCWPFYFFKTINFIDVPVRVYMKFRTSILYNSVQVGIMWWCSSCTSVHVYVEFVFSLV